MEGFQVAAHQCLTWVECSPWRRDGERTLAQCALSPASSMLIFFPGWGTAAHVSPPVAARSSLPRRASRAFRGAHVPGGGAAAMPCVPRSEGAT